MVGLSVKFSRIPKVRTVGKGFLGGILVLALWRSRRWVLTYLHGGKGLFVGCLMGAPGESHKTEPGFADLFVVKARHFDGSG